MDGLKSFLNHHQVLDKFEFISEGIGIGGMEKEVYKSAEKLLVMEEVDVLVAFVDEKVVDLLSPLILASGKLLIIVNAGANIPLNWIPQPNVIRLNLQHAFLSWLTGSLVGEKEDKKAASVSTFYDCGYWHVAAMVNNFVHHGGSIEYNYINNQAYNDKFNIHELEAFLKANHQTKNLLCLFDSLPASLLFKFLNNNERAAELKLFCSPMMFQPLALKEAPFHFTLEGFVPWLEDREDESNLAFRKICKKRPDIFSLQGYETGLVLHEILGAYENEEIDPMAVIDQLKKAVLLGPRGALKLDVETQIFLAPITKCLLKPDTVNLETSIIAEYESDWKTFVNQPAPVNPSGWTNTYLCY